MGRKLYISDWHYGHANVLGFDNRPFVNVEQMNEELIRRWNNAVSDGDLVYILGDMFWCSPKQATPIMEQLMARRSWSKVIMIAGMTASSINCL